MRLDELEVVGRAGPGAKPLGENHVRDLAIAVARKISAELNGGMNITSAPGVVSIWPREDALVTFGDEAIDLLEAAISTVASSLVAYGEG